MKSLIVFYIPMPLGITEAELEKREIRIRENFLKEGGSIGLDNLRNDFHTVVIHDPDRKKVKTEVFFNPY